MPFKLFFEFFVSVYPCFLACVFQDDDVTMWAKEAWRRQCLSWPRIVWFVQQQVSSRDLIQFLTCTAGMRIFQWSEIFQVLASHRLTWDDTTGQSAEVHEFLWNTPLVILIPVNSWLCQCACSVLNKLMWRWQHVDLCSFCSCCPCCIYCAVSFSPV